MKISFKESVWLQYKLLWYNTLVANDLFWEDNMKVLMFNGSPKANGLYIYSIGRDG